MLKGIAAAASAMLPQMKAQEVIANNLANAATAGFKRDIFFEQSLSAAQSRSMGNDIADWQMSQHAGIVVDFSSGALMRTDNPLDVAIDGGGYFVIETPDGERFTRNGNFLVSPDQLLVTSNGFPVMGLAGELRLSNGTITISTDGNVEVDGLNIGKLRIARFADPAVLVRSSSSLFMIGDSIAQPEDDSESVIRQGFLEQSNVNTIEELINMIVTMRIYESDQKAIRIQDDTLGRAIQDLGRVR